MITATAKIARTLLSLSALLGSMSCDAPAQTPAGGESMVATPVVVQPSWYDLPGVFQDHRGREVRLDVARGHPTLLAMFYARCPKACPMLIAEVHSVLRQLTPEARSEVRVVLVTLDPVGDTPEVLAEVFKTRGLDEKTFTLLRADDGTIRTLATVMKVRYASMTDGEIDHSSRIVLLDDDGRPVAEQDGLQRPLEPLIAAVNALAR